MIYEAKVEWQWVFDINDVFLVFWMQMDAKYIFTNNYPCLDMVYKLKSTKYE